MSNENNLTKPIFDNNTPIYLQLVASLKKDIISKRILPGSKLPSVRDLALILRVKPNTIQKALTELEDLKLIYTERTNGKYLTKDVALISKYREEYASSLSKEYLLQMKDLNFSKEEIIEYINKIKEWCQHVSKSYSKKEVLKDVNLTIPRGKIIGLLGKNGMGKTTLIKLINDLLTPTAGTILVNGQKIGVESKKIISYLPERTYLDKSKTIEEIMHMFKEFYDNFNYEKALSLFKDLDLDIHEKLSKMSKGMQEKVQLVLVMSREAELYILDEPLGGVDPATRDYILDTILSNFKEGSSVIISTHLISDIERILDEVIFIDKGKIILQSDADELRNKESASIDEIFRRKFKC